MRPRLTLRSITAHALNRFRRDRKGSAAVEFAMIATPFLALMFAIIETSIILFAGQVLETSTQDTARLIMTGQSQLANMSATQFKSQLCSRLTSLFNCANVDVEVVSYPDFGSVNLSSPVNNGTYTSPSGYNPGNAGQIVVVRTFYQWPVFVTGLGSNPADINGGKRLLASVAAFRNEPF